MQGRRKRQPGRRRPRSPEEILRAAGKGNAKKIEAMFGRLEAQMGKPPSGGGEPPESQEWDTYEPGEREAAAPRGAQGTSGEFEGDPDTPRQSPDEPVEFGSMFRPVAPPPAATHPEQTQTAGSPGAGAGGPTFEFQQAQGNESLREILERIAQGIEQLPEEIVNALRNGV